MACNKHKKLYLDILDDKLVDVIIVIFIKTH